MSPAEGDRDTQRILIVDDEPAVREALQRSLAFEGYDTEVAVDGADALEKATAYQPDLVVLDIQMPRMDGLTAARRMRGAGTTTPILMLTARDTVGDRVTGLDAGADDYLVKPFELDELFARVRALLRRSSYAAAAAAGAGPEDDSLTFADLRMDLATREVTRNGRQVELTRTEFTLLEMFLAHPRQVLTREQILKAVWGFDFEPSSNSLDVYVMYLRRKTEAGASLGLCTPSGAWAMYCDRVGRSEQARTPVPHAADSVAAGDVGGGGGGVRGGRGVGHLLVHRAGKLYDQVDGDLKDMVRRPGTVQALLQRCTQTPQKNSDMFSGRTEYVEAVKEEGAPCVDPSSPGIIKATGTDKNVIKSANSKEAVFRNGTDEDGNSVRVLTLYLGVDQTDSQGVALLLAAPSRALNRPSTNWPSSCSSSPVSESSAPAPQASPSPVPVSVRWTNSPRPLNTWPALRTWPSGSPWTRTVTTRSPGSPGRSTR